MKRSLLSLTFVLLLVTPLFGVTRQGLPFRNITMEDGHPVWNGRCTQCQSCIAVCPVDAIEFGHRTRKKRRYYLFADGRQKFPRESRSETEPPSGDDSDVKKM